MINMILSQETPVSFCEFSLRRHYSKWSLDYILPAIFYILGMITFSFLCLTIGFIVPVSTVVSIVFFTTFILSAMGVISYICYYKKILSSRLEQLESTTFFPSKILNKLLIFEKDRNTDFSENNFPNSFFVPMGLHLGEYKKPEPDRSRQIENLLIAFHSITSRKKKEPPSTVNIIKEILFKDYVYLKEPIDNISLISNCNGEEFLEAFLKFSVTFLEHNGERISLFWRNEFASPSQKFYPSISLINSITRKFSESINPKNFLKETVLANLRLANVFLYGKIMKSLNDRDSAKEIIKQRFPEIKEVDSFLQAGNFIGLILKSLSKETANFILQTNTIEELSPISLLETVSRKKTTINSLAYASDKLEDQRKISQKKNG